MTEPIDGLTPQAKAEIAEAIRIVREDKFEQYARTAIGKHTAKPEPKPEPEPTPTPTPAPTPAPTPTPTPTPTPPPPKNEPPTPVEPPRKKSRLSYWPDQDE